MTKLEAGKNDTTQSVDSFYADLIAKHGTKVPKSHPAAELFPMMPPTEFQALVENIRTAGLQIPVSMFEGEILDGRNRFLACLEAGITPTTCDWDGIGDPVEYVVRVNLMRRHLSDDQRACIAVSIQHRLGKTAKHVRAVKAAAKRHGKSACLEVDGASKHQQRTRAKAAATLHVSENKVRKASELADLAPQLFEKVGAGEIKLAKALGEATRAVATITPTTDQSSASNGESESKTPEKPVDPEVIAFAEQAFIRLHELNARRAGQPLSSLAKSKLTNLAKLINEVLNTKEITQ